MSEITKSYEPAEVEKKWYAAWLKAGAFAGRVEGGKAPYTIVMPPPNVTGVLHVGHVLNNTLQDILIRRARLEGKAALWIPGTDHASISTHAVVERELKKNEGKTRWQIGRTEFLKRAKAWQEKHGGIILQQLRAFGCSCDWDRTVYTMDPDYDRAVFTAFVELFKRGGIYRGKRMVNWCPATLTALSDEEVIMKPVRGSLYKVRYALVDAANEFIQVATTRPETIPGDVAIAVHPDDPRYRGWVGKFVWRPLNRAQIPIVADPAVDREFGSGALKITPAHDKVDYEIGKRHSLPVIDVLEPNGVLNELAGPGLAGLERFAGRKKAVEMLKDSGALAGEEPYENNVGYSERADVPIEPRLTWQWWMRYPRVEEAKEAVEKGLIQFHPDRWKKVYLHWLNNIQDWCISRQLWWGQRIPVWYRKGLDRESLSEADLGDPAKVHVSVEGPPDPQNWEQEDDVLDTWASSWLWPIATLGWPDLKKEAMRGFDYFYPTETLVTAPEIIFFWVARMIMAGLEFARPGEPVDRRIPFRHVYLNGIVRDAQGRKMSKSLGNSPDPFDLISKYGADGLRFGMVSIAPQGLDVRFQEERIEGGKNLCNKLWNACRFRQMSGPMEDNTTVAAIVSRMDAGKFDGDDKAILQKLAAIDKDVERSLQEFDFAQATQKLYAFFWGDFCDWYVEVSKSKLQSQDTRGNCLAIQDLVLRQTLLLLHPFIPFITEELWQLQGCSKDGKAIESSHLQFQTDLLAKVGKFDEAALQSVQRLQQFVSQARALKAEHGFASRRDAQFAVAAGDDAWSELQSNMARLLRMAGAAEFVRKEKVDDAPAAVTPLGTVYLILAGAVDAATEKARLAKELEKLAGHIAGTEARLANPAFVGKAPPAVLEGARKQLADLKARKAEFERLLKAL